MFRSAIRPSQNFALIFNVLRLCSRLVGFDGADPNFQINLRTCFSFGGVIVTIICTIINAVQQFSENPISLVEGLCMFGTELQGITKCLTLCLYSKNIVAMRFELEDLYAQYQEKGSVYCAILQRSCRRSRKIITVAGWITFITICGEHAAPIIAHLVTGKRYLILNFEIPGIDLTTTYGFLTTMGAHSIGAIFAGFCLFAGDMFVIIFPSHCPLFADIFERKVQDLNESIADNSQGDQTKSMLEDLIEWHKKYNAFNDQCNNTFYYAIAVQITTAGISMVCTLYIFLFGDWPTAYVYVFYPAIGIYAYCFLGTQINNCVKNDRVIASVYNIDWFMLPIPEQKLVLIMLMKTQTPSEIQIGGIIQLSVNTGLQITKFIYSIFMMMVECFDG